MAETLTVPTRDELVRRYERDYQLRAPAALVGAETAPGVDARIVADMLLPVYAEVARQANTIPLEGRSSTELEETAEDLGLERRIGAVGATGSVTVSTATGGAYISPGLELREVQSGQRFIALQEASPAHDQDEISIGGVSTGPNTNLAPGTVLTWTSPPPGLFATCTVAEQADGSGLSGGRDQELDADIVERIRTEKSNPAAAGNDADYRKAALKTPNVAIQAAFTYPGILGGGTIGLAFTLRPSSSGGSRLPNPTQIAAVRANIIGSMPTDDRLFMATVVADPVALILRVRWRSGAAQWQDGTQWPPYNAGHFVVDNTITPQALTCSVATTMTSPPSPRVGQSVAVWDRDSLSFSKKRIKTVSGSNPWTLTFDDTADASDKIYVPAVGQLVSPWSAAMPALLPDVLAHFDQLGPGEQVSSPYDIGGGRQRRTPSGTKAWPSQLTGRVVTPLYALSQVDEVLVAEPSLPYTPPAGTPGSIVKLTTLNDLAVYPL